MIYTTRVVVLFLNFIFVLSSLAQTPAKYALTDQEPKGIHLLYGPDPSTEISIVWYTNVEIKIAIVYFSLVEVEDEFEPIDQVACKHDRMQKGFIGREPVVISNSTSYFVHRVYMSGLAPDRKYCYEIQSGAASSHIFSFRTSNSNSRSYNSNVTSSFLILSQFKRQNEALLGLEVGQKVNALIYLNSVLDLLNQTLYSDKNILSFVPLGPNLAQNSNLFFNNLFPLMNQWPLNSTFYSFDSNQVHFITFWKYSNANVDLLERDLIQANRNRFLVPWIVVYLPNRLESFAQFKNLESILYVYDVDLVFELNLDNSNYERTYPLMRSILKYESSYDSPEMPIRITLPSGRSDSVNNSMYFSTDSKWMSFNQTMSSKIDNYGMLEVINSTVIYWSIYIVTQNGSNSLIDRLELKKDHSLNAERVYSRRKTFLNYASSQNSSTYNYSIYESDSVPSSAQPKSGKMFFIFLAFSCFTLLALIVFNYVRRYMKHQKQIKLNLMTYSNLNEETTSDFDLI